MNRLRILSFKIFKYSILFYTLVPLSVAGQIVPDVTLPVSSSITNQDQSIIIEGGNKSGSNLFHSFEEFSVPTGSTVYFNNSLDVQNIFSRVTGSSISNIDGLIQANGTANLFLINPNGTIFGPNASLNIGGSFLASTASHIQFADGTQFSAKSSMATPLLTISVPIGLGLSSGSNGEIKVQGSSRSLVDLTTTFARLTEADRVTGLQVQPGKTLALVGGNVVLEGGTLTAQGGRVEIGSVDSGLVKLNSTPEGWSLGYEGVSTFKNIQLSQSALVDASGNGGGFVQVQGSGVKLTDGSVILIQNQGSQPSGNLSVNATEFLELSGASTNGGVPTTIRTQPISSGNGGDIVVRTGRLLVQDGAGINSITYGSGKGGNLSINVSDATDVLGYSPIRPSFNSNIAAYAFGVGNAGSVTVSTEDLTITNGGAVNSSTLGIGKGGSVALNIGNSVKLTGANPGTFAPSLIGASAFNVGDAGTLIINTSKLIIEDGGAVSSSTLASASAGSGTINASDSVEVSGKLPDIKSAGIISSSAYIADPVVQQIFGLPLKPSGRSGDITVNTNKLSVNNGGLITVNNDGEGDAGILRINASNILLKNQGRISAATASGEGGNVDLQTRKLQIIDGSSITTTANGIGSGGNLGINTDTLVALRNSDITANAFKGRGGNIQITTQGLFLSPDSDITASSQFGIDGNINIQTFGLDIRNSITPLQNRLVTTEQVTAGSCLARRNVERGSFLITGTGGLPINPYSGIERWDNLTEVQSVENEKAQSQELSLPPVNNNANQSLSRKWQPGDPIVEAQALILKADGRASLIASSPQPEISNADLQVCQAEQAKS
ncbi:filamentous hemagglutinin N-terminal domain-containing protein [Synechocystis sp. PCC 7509]|uniref:two-partner secretion domain-containing protein n=1 Tax=Synechocystis sp. PCC 7509 TaxID=927677 RepID=UPI0002ACE07E|nr:filamentous hemagglutinin N-terminal domain-containing protein [Synechocystis sp. PCC 7509]